MRLSFATQALFIYPAQYLSMLSPPGRHNNPDRGLTAREESSLDLTIQRSPEKNSALKKFYKKHIVKAKTTCYNGIYMNH